MAIYRCAACGALNRIKLGETSGAACSRCRSALDVSGAPQPIDAAALVSAILSSPAPLLVGFAAPGSASCASLDDLARTRAGQIVCLRVDAVAEPAAAVAYSVVELPQLLLFSEGAEVGRLPATLPARDIARWMAVTGCGEG